MPYNVRAADTGGQNVHRARPATPRDSSGHRPVSSAVIRSLRDSESGNRRRIHGRLIWFQLLLARQSIAFPDAHKLVPRPGSISPRATLHNQLHSHGGVNSRSPREKDDSASPHRWLQPGLASLCELTKSRKPDPFPSLFGGESSFSLSSFPRMAAQYSRTTWSQI